MTKITGKNGRFAYGNNFWIKKVPPECWWDWEAVKKSGKLLVSGDEVATEIANKCGGTTLETQLWWAFRQLSYQCKKTAWIFNR